MLSCYFLLLDSIFAYVIGVLVTIYPWVIIFLIMILYYSKSTIKRLFVAIFFIYGVSYLSFTPRQIYGQVIYQNRYCVYLRRKYFIIDKIRYNKPLKLGSYYYITFLPSQQKILIVKHDKQSVLSYWDCKRNNIINQYKPYPLVLALCTGESNYINPKTQLILKNLNLWVVFVGSGIITRLFLKSIIKIFKHGLGLFAYINYRISRPDILLLIILLIIYLYSRLTLPHIGAQRIILYLLLNHLFPFNSQEIFWIITSYQIIIQPYLIFSWSFQISTLMSILYRINIGNSIFLLFWFNKWNIFSWIYINIFTYVIYMVWIIVFACYNKTTVLIYLEKLLNMVIHRIPCFGILSIKIANSIKLILLLLSMLYIYNQLQKNRNLLNCL